MILVMLTFVLVLFLSEQKWLTAMAYFVGAFVSMVCGVVGVIVGTQSNYRVAYCSRFGLAPTFQIAYQASCSIGFGLVSFALLCK
jgi:Na+/H+-translocating membrane pyrophosphatase